MLAGELSCALPASSPTGMTRNKADSTRQPLDYGEGGRRDIPDHEPDVIL
jgi:hypothetical protein